MVKLYIRAVAQSVEHGTHNLGVVSPILTLETRDFAQIFFLGTLTKYTLKSVGLFGFEALV